MKKVIVLLIAGLLGASFVLSAETTARTTNIGGIEFVCIPAGEFMMGSHDKEGDVNEHPRHKVELSGFWRMLYTLTEGETAIEIIAFILDILDHDDYNKKFGYRKK